MGKGSSTLSYYLARARWLANQDKFGEALDEIKLAFEFDSGKSEVEEISDVEEEIRILHRQRVNALVERVERILDKRSIDVTQEDRISIEDDLNALQSIAAEETARDLAARWHKYQRKTVMVRSRRFRKLLNRAQILAEDGCFDGAQEILQEARKYAREDQPGDIEEKEQLIENYRQASVKVLTQELESLFTKDPLGLTQADLERGQTILDKLEVTVSVPFEAKLRAERWRAFLTRRNALLDLEESCSRLQELWEEPYLMLACYDEALDLAQQKAQAYPNEQLAQDLLEEAKRRRTAAYQRQEDFTTLAVQGGFEALAAELRHLQQEGHEYLPKFDLHPDKEGENQEQVLVPIEKVPANEAIAHLTYIARDFAGRKADEYRRRAESELKINPEEAAKWIEEARHLEFLSKARHDELQAYYDEVVVPALERQKQARELIDTAMMYRQEDLEAAWMLLREASQLLPHLEDTRQARDYFRPWLTVQWDSLLRRAEDALWNNNDVEKAQQLAKRVLDSTGEVPEFEKAFLRAQNLVERCERVKAKERTER